MKEILDSYNITFEWEVPQGHRDYYIIVYNPIDEPHSQQSQQVRIMFFKQLQEKLLYNYFVCILM